MTLDALKAGKPTRAAVVPSPPVTIDSSDTRRGQTLRLHVPAWKALKRLAADEQKTSHELLLEAVNLLFKSREMPPIA
jgi:hypothetical protein